MVYCPPMPVEISPVLIITTIAPQVQLNSVGHLTDPTRDMKGRKAQGMPGFRGNPAAVHRIILAGSGLQDLLLVKGFDVAGKTRGTVKSQGVAADDEVFNFVLVE